ncbi:radical SAM domain-containing protein [Vibrio phage D480]|nr:hypothetical protein MYOV011v1_p0313 [Vibrio phage 6E35.1a]
MKKYCMAPFASPAITPDGFKLCSYPGQKVYDDLSFWNSEEIQELRRIIRDGGTPESCAACMASRDGMLITHNVHELRDDYVPINFKNLFIARSNKCDYACEMCSSSISHSYDRMFNDGKIGIVENNFDLTPYLHETRHAAISGGNPVLDKKLIEIIDQLDVDRLESMFFTSNGSVFPDAFLDSIKRLERTDISLIFSIDGPQEYNESVRIGCKQSRFYSTVKKVMERVRDNSNIYTCFEFTATNTSITKMAEMYDEIIMTLTNEELSRIKFVFNTCSFPHSMSCFNLSSEQYATIEVQIAYFESIMRTSPQHLTEAILKRLREYKERYDSQRIL